MNPVDPSPVRPRRRSWLLVVATAITAVLVGAVVGGLLMTGRAAPAGDPTATAVPSGRATVIPWIAASPEPTRAAGVGVSTGRVPLCSLSQLRVGSRPGGTVMGTWRAGVTVTDRGATACTLGASSIALQARSGGRYVTVGRTTVQADAPGGFRLEPGRTAHLWGSLTACFTSRHFSTEVLEPTFLLVGGERVRLDGTVPNDFRPLCPHPDAFGGPSTFDQEGDVPEPTSPFGGLEAVMHLPATVAAGEVVDYTVTLTNTTSRTVDLTPCPTFDQTYVDSGSGGKALLVITHGVLNCGPVPALRSGRSATFAMRLAISEHAHGQAKISWALDGDPSATVLRTIRG